MEKVEDEGSRIEDPDGKEKWRHGGSSDRWAEELLAH